MLTNTYTRANVLYHYENNSKHFMTKHYSLLLLLPLIFSVWTIVLFFAILIKKYLFKCTMSIYVNLAEKGTYNSNNNNNHQHQAQKRKLLVLLLFFFLFFFCCIYIICHTTCFSSLSMPSVKSVFFSSIEMYFIAQIIISKIINK